MRAEQAIWYPFWYELDQPLEVGAVADFDFYHRPVGPMATESRPVFYNGDWNDRHLYYRAKKRILGISHPQLGSIEKIDTNGLDYTFVLADGRVQKVEAEETPGLVYGFPEPIRDWRVYVEMEPA